MSSSFSDSHGEEEDVSSPPSSSSSDDDDGDDGDEGEGDDVDEGEGDEGEGDDVEGNDDPSFVPPSSSFSRKKGKEMTSPRPRGGKVTPPYVATLDPELLKAEAEVACAAANTPDENADAVNRIGKMLERGLHPDTPDAEAQQAMRLAAAQCAKLNMSQAEVMRRREGRLKDEGEMAGGMGCVFVTPSGGADKKRKRRAQFATWVHELIGAASKLFKVEAFTTHHVERLKVTFYGIRTHAVLAAKTFEKIVNRVGELVARFDAKKAAESSGGRRFASKGAATTAARRSYAEGLANGLRRAANEENDAAAKREKAREEKVAKAKKRLSSLEKLMQRCLGATGSGGAKERELAEKIKTIVKTEEEKAARKAAVKDAFVAPKDDASDSDFDEFDDIYGSSDDDVDSGHDDAGAGAGGDDIVFAGEKTVEELRLEAKARHGVVDLTADDDDDDDDEELAKLGKLMKEAQEAVQKSQESADVAKALVVHRGDVAKAVLEKEKVKVRAGRKRKPAKRVRDAYEQGKVDSAKIQLRGSATEKMVT